MNGRIKKPAFPRHLVVVFSLLIIAIGVAGYFFYDRQSKIMKMNLENELSAIADSKVREIAAWHRERRGDALVVAHSTAVIRLIREFLEGPSSSNVREELLEWMRSLPDSYQYRSVLLLDTRMRVRLYVGDETKLIGNTAASLARDALRERRVFFSDLRWGQVKHVIRLDIFAPLVVEEKGVKKPIGVLVLRADPTQFLYPLIQAWPIPSRSAESLLVRIEGNELVFLNELRHRKDTALKLRLPVTSELLPAAMAARGRVGIAEGIDYRGVKVLAALRVIPGTPWYLITKIDADEIYAPLRQLSGIVFVMMVILIVLAGVIAGYIWRKSQADFYRREYEAEEVLRRSEQKFKELFENMGSCVAIYEAVGDGEDFVFKDFNTSAEKVERINREDLIGKSVLGVFPGVREFGLFDVFQRVWRTGQAEHHPVAYYRDDRVAGWKENYVYKLPSGEIVAIYDDVTAMKQAEEALKKSEEMYRELVENINDIVFSLDAKGFFTYISPVVRQDFGYEPSDIIGRFFGDFIFEEDLPKVANLFQDVLRGIMKPAEYRVLKKNGDTRWVRSSSRPIRIGDEVVGIRGVFSDITERKRAEEDLTKTFKQLQDTKDMLIQSDKLAAVGKLSAGVAHEILNPLNIIGLRLQLLEIMEPLSDKMKEAFRIARAQIERITKITRDLSQFSRVTTRHFSRVDLKEVMESVFALTAPRLKMENVVLNFQYEPGISELYLDRFRMEQVFLNLINNALDAMKDKKDKVIRVIVSLVSERGKKSVRIIFSDNGTGIEEEIAGRIFEPFFTTKEAGKGTGLGLSICYGIVQDHNGKIWVENNEWGGASFFIELPVE